MFGLLRRQSTPLATAALLLIALALLVTNSRGRQRVDPLGTVFLELVTPIADLGARISSTLGSTWNSYVDLVGARQERDWLRDRVRVLEAEADASDAVAQENSRLKALLDLQDGLLVLHLLRQPRRTGSVEGSQAPQHLVTNRAQVGVADQGQGLAHGVAGVHESLQLA